MSEKKVAFACEVGVLWDTPLNFGHGGQGGGLMWKPAERLLYFANTGIKKSTASHTLQACRPICSRREPVALARRPPCVHQSAHMAPHCTSSELALVRHWQCRSLSARAMWEILARSCVLLFPCTPIGLVTFLVAPRILACPCTRCTSYRNFL